ncbi:hypothetical protein [Actinomadura sp. DC4]|uniref:hypothetical protein n=1 Tax=Actinomadura sp. DC4 TaxID=3055069 RepID=UPI0025AFB92D|nr:hypothetical protein [Actinomadura sp. DC4]MDN3355141.1 hypothetical protein [Actinomadura sp. DC4]
MIRAVALVLALLLLCGCGVRPTGVVYAGDPPVATATASPQSQVFFLLNGVPTPVQRTAGPADPQLVFDALLDGPTREERAKGLTTELGEIQYITVHELDGRALLIETSPPAPKLLPEAFAQIYCTGLLLSGQTALKISYLDTGTPAYAPADCTGTKPIVPPSEAVPTATPARGKPGGPLRSP